ncbi:MAG: hypothetical protein GTO55_11575, partial [Armatimonadetes bacterium]|nr:hypothetical protein [Armatimonadota bacterium]NIM24855.1 hypothetical protein [Armatimonadota bacterium]NIM68745.1 hypothetical protein [Armatimonadota bacterium]NIM76038.1 hypothetical protein [Armatimonadota bacterium]NIN06942.1 hypothetical protein [Armatimonadota bacterium]
RFILRQVSRAAVVIVLFALAANVPGRGPSDLVVSWPARVAGAAVEGMAYLSASFDRAQAFLSEIEFVSTSRPVPSSDGEKSVLPDYEPSEAVQAALI